MKKLLVVVDMQNDFIDGSLGSIEAQMIVPKIVEKIDSWDGDIAFTLDTHFENYLYTNEGVHLPIEHCIFQTKGYELNSKVLNAIERTNNKVLKFSKLTFGSVALAMWAYQYDYIEIVGLCTDICVVSNALLIKAYNHEAEIVVISDCCAGTTIDKHNAALEVMTSCQINIKKME